MLFTMLSTRARRAVSIGAVLAALVAFSAPPVAADAFDFDKFRQLEEILPTPNAERTASGAPGRDYWQQQADYEIDVTLDEAEQRLVGSETVTYTNNSPDTLRYLWMQIDPNLLAPDAPGRGAEMAPRLREGRDDKPASMGYSSLRRLLYLEGFDGGATISAVRGATGEPLEHTVVQTMMRIDLPQPLAPGEMTTFSVDWSYRIPDAVSVRLRSGSEYFEEDDNYIYEIAQWFPRMAAYTDTNGWQHKQFLGRGEFTLEFGDYLVRITAPVDHVVTATGTLENPDEVLKPVWRERLEQAKTAAEPIFVITPDEAEANESARGEGTKTWVFHAENVRDFAFAASRKFIWDAWGYNRPTGDYTEPVMAMSFYPNEAEPLWSTYSTQAIVHTIEVFSEHTFEYPYPVAISVNGPVGGMEYPMICFNGPRTTDEGYYFGHQVPDGAWRFSKYGLISVIIHEIGHNYFPMIVNSDERQWTWMDEGLNTFVQTLAEARWEEGYPTRRGEPEQIVDYMTSEWQVPIMTNSESLLQFGSNAYAKPAVALNILRETVLGRELFDFAFQEYSRRWMFKRPQPADFFRSMEDASGIDLDWFWRGWFYTTDHVDVGLTGVRLYELDSRDPDREKPKRRQLEDEKPTTRREEGFGPMEKRVDRYPALRDFYNEFDQFDVTEKDRRDYKELLEKLDPWERELLDVDRRFYVIDLVNEGGLVMPVPLRLTYADGSVEEMTLPAEIWRANSTKTSKLVISDQELVAIELDPRREIADADRTNNLWPAEPEAIPFRLRKNKIPKSPMEEAREAESGGES
ncbi:MAG: M1 family metallopeptidase [Acidobacteriota bacterium]